ncbi:MAG: patatin-like phospholipase family protein [Bacteroidota bacterium]
MTKTKIFVLAYFILLLFSGCEETELPVFQEATGTPSGTALIITGASARITQQLALIERLHEQGRFNNLAFISGVSSGAINATMLNGILDPDLNFTFEDYKNIVLNLSNSDVLDNSRNNLPVDTRPLWNTFDRIITNTLGYDSFDDLPIPTAYSNTNFDTREIESASNVPELDQVGGRLVESLMATTAFPVAFPLIRINEKTYVDGGLVENIPANVVLQEQLRRAMPFDTVYIVTFQKNTETRWGDELNFLGIGGTREDLLEVTLEKTGFDTDELSQQAFLDDLIRIQTNYPEFARRCFVYEPAVEDAPYYGVFDFSSETAMDSYNSVREWAQTNTPLRLGEFLDFNGIGEE